MKYHGAFMYDGLSRYQLAIEPLISLINKKLVARR